MTLKDWLTRSYLTIGKRLFGYSNDVELGAFMNPYGEQVSREYIDMYTGFVWKCINIIAKAVGKYEPRFYTLKGKEWVEVVNHEFLTVLNNPNKNISSFDLFMGHQVFMELMGESFIYSPLGKITNRPKELHLLRPDRVSVAIDKKGDVSGYFLKRSGAEPLPLLYEEVLHSMEFNPSNPYRGKGTVQAAKDYINTEVYSSKLTSTFMKNNGAVSGIVTLKGDITKDTFQKYVQQWRERHDGYQNAGKTAFIRGADADYMKLGLGFNELDMTNLRKMTKEDIREIFGIPRAMFGTSDDVGLGRASVETFEYIFITQVVEPAMNKLDDALTRYMRRFYKDDNIIIEHTNITPADKTFGLEEKKAAVDLWRTRNEIRTDEGLDDLDGGDDLRTPITNLPLDESMTATEAEPAKSIKIVLAQPTDKKKDLTPEIKEAFRITLMKNQLAYERLYRKTIKPILLAQEKETLHNLEAVAGKDWSSLLFSISEANKEFDQKLYPVLVDMYLTQGALALVFAGDDETEFTISRAVETFIHNSTLKMAKGYNQDTLDRLAASLSEGVNAGESLDKLQKRVTSIYSEARGYRSERIARTETLKASNNATNFAYKQTGFVKAKQWFNNPGACEFCAALDGKTIALDHTFVAVGETVEGVEGGEYAVDYDSIENPPVHPNCRCTIIPVR